MVEFDNLLMYAITRKPSKSYSLEDIIKNDAISINDLDIDNFLKPYTSNQPLNNNPNYAKNNCI